MSLHYLTLLFVQLLISSLPLTRCWCEAICTTDTWNLQFAIYERLPKTPCTVLYITGYIRKIYRTPANFCTITTFKTHEKVNFTKSYIVEQKRIGEYFHIKIFSSNL